MRSPLGLGTGPGNDTLPRIESPARGTVAVFRGSGEQDFVERAVQSDAFPGEVGSYEEWSGAVGPHARRGRQLLVPGDLATELGAAQREQVTAQAQRG